MQVAGVLAVCFSVDHVRQDLVKFVTRHNPLSPIPQKLLGFLTAWWPFRLCSFSEARVTSFAPCATATCCCRSNNLRVRQSRCARSLRRRGARIWCDNRREGCQLLSASVTDQSSRPGHYLRSRSLSSAYRRRFRSCLRAARSAGSSFATASARRSPPCGAAKSKKPTRHETCQSCETVAGKLPA